MRKVIFLFALATLLSSSPIGVRADEPQPVNTNSPLSDQQELQRIEQRVLEIKKMDKSSLSRQERKDLRKELISLKKSARMAGGGVYLSVGAIIIIILVLILIL